MSLNVGFFFGRVCSPGIGSTIPFNATQPTYSAGGGGSPGVGRQAIPRVCRLGEIPSREGFNQLPQRRACGHPGQKGSRSLFLNPGSSPVQEMPPPLEVSASFPLAIASRSQPIAKSWPLYKLESVYPFLPFSPWAKPPLFLAYMTTDPSLLQFLSNTICSPWAKSIFF